MRVNHTFFLRDARRDGPFSGCSSVVRLGQYIAPCEEAMLRARLCGAKDFLAERKLLLTEARRATLSFVKVWGLGMSDCLIIYVFLLFFSLKYKSLFFAP